MGCVSTKQIGQNEFIVRTNHAGDQIKKQYELSDEVLGKGAFAKVYKATSITNPHLKFAIKSINKDKMGSEDLKAIGDEIKALQSLDHPSIIKYHDAYEDKKFMFIITEF